MSRLGTTRIHTGTASGAARTRRAVMAVVAGAWLVGVTPACSSSEDDSGSSGTSASGGSQDTACAKDTRKDVFTAGLSKQGAGLTVKIVESTPSPPQKGTNTMTLEIADGAGQPLDGATVVVTPWMPDHAHGSALVPVVTPMSGGRYAVTKLYYPMPGLWQVTVSVQVPGATAQEIRFNFCFDG